MIMFRGKREFKLVSQTLECKFNHTGFKVTTFDLDLGIIILYIWKSEQQTTCTWFLSYIDLSGSVIFNCHLTQSKNLLTPSNNIFTNLQIIFGRREYIIIQPINALSIKAILSSTGFFPYQSKFCFD